MLTQDRKPRMLSTDVVSDSDEAARDVVFTLGAPKVILIKIDAKNVNLGLPQKTAATKEQLQEKRQGELAVAATYGIDADSYRDRTGKTHNGKHLIEGAGRVRLDLLVSDLQAAGYKLTAATWFQKTAHPGKRVPDPTQQFTFSLEGDAIEMTEQVKSFLAEVYVDNLHVWCNPKMTKDGTAFRLDTLNGFSGQKPKNPASAPGVRIRYAAAESGSSGYDIEE